VLGAELAPHIHSGLVMKFTIQLCTLALAVACSTVPSSHRIAPQPASRALVSAGDLAQFPGGWNALEALSRLRPEFLNPVPGGYGGSQVLMPTVYINGTERGSIEMLRTLRLAEVRSMRYYRSIDATTRFGAAHTGAVIDVTLVTSRF
jgi:hypothetical protein